MDEERKDVDREKILGPNERLQEMMKAMKLLQDEVEAGVNDLVVESAKQELKALNDLEHDLIFLV